MRAWFGSDNAETGWRYDSAFVNFVQSGYEPTAFWVRNDHYDVDVVVIRGSYALADWVQDANLWSEAVIVQLASKLVPLNNLFDDEFLRDLVFWASSVHGDLRRHRGAHSAASLALTRRLWMRVFGRWRRAGIPCRSWMRRAGCCSTSSAPATRHGRVTLPFDRCVSCTIRAARSECAMSSLCDACASTWRDTRCSA